eukprot:4867497-Pyramimonas_sp.AAC.1
MKGGPRVAARCQAQALRAAMLSFLRVPSLRGPRGRGPPMAHLGEEAVFTGLSETNRGLTSGLKTLRSSPGGFKSPEALAGGVETP